ncbi:ATP-binding protein [Streptomyces albireticuli]|uniref:ATP-binding protein n=1 Tax=Streptomyces albireticuli TaxID=1940 RepID=UPI00369E3A48
MTTHPAATGAPSYSESLPCQADSARRARLLVTVACHTWGLPRLVVPGILVISELVGNAVEHTRSRQIEIVVSRPQPERLRVAVADNSRTRPTPRTAASDDEHGRGLAVIGALADAWGTDPLPWGKRVWADLHTGAG